MWDWDPEASKNKLVIDVDPLVLINDPFVHQILDQLSTSTVETEGGLVIGQSTEKGDQKGPLEWIGIILLKIVEIAVEILA